ncbi:MAG: O-antigen ligase family protein [Rivularia sp. (in: Bacteria)]|nr:O-antigen ligase family protein [Rivularia sp. MS3]
MTVARKKTRHSLLTYYQCFLAVVAVLILYTAADIYYYDLGVTPAVKYIVGGLCVAASPLLISFRKKNFKYVPIGVILWCGLYSGISAASFLQSVPTEYVTQELETRILAVIFILLMTLILSGEPIVRTTLRYTLFIAAGITIFNNFTELFNPEAFNEFNITGRPAGFYIDPNKSGASLIMAMIFSIGLLPKKLRIFYFIIIFSGTFITFSRGATLCLIILLFLFLFKRVIPTSQVYSIFGSLLILLMIIGNVGNYLVNQASELGVLNYGIEQRIIAITNFADPDKREADDGSSRSDVAMLAWKTFTKKPFLGYGIGYIREWGDILPHNMYLTYMVENGFLGCLILPAFVFAVTRNSYGEARQLSLFFGVFILLWALFSNTVLEDRETLTVFVLLAVMSKYSRLERINPG